MLKLFTIDQEKCIRCGACAAVCPTSVIAVTKEDGPHAVSRRCIACGHCSAVCPTSALDHRHAPLEKQPFIDKSHKITAAAAKQFLRSRRSIRCYQEKTVERNQLLELLDAARLAPTGSNAQGVSYLIIDEKKVLAQITEAVISWMEEEIAANSAWASYFKGTVKTYRTTKQDVILRNAPCLIIAMAKKIHAARGRDNTHFSLAYAELYAPTLGLGSCWAGFFEACASAEYPPLLSLLHLPAGVVVTGAIMAGYPQYSYKRLVDRNPLDVTFWQE
ncbi:MAG: nitroreductase family protein [Sporomusaceae bacterium]|nr:nitroreductase family protein [Sporomusaceae bacterium]